MRRGGHLKNGKKDAKNKGGISDADSEADAVAAKAAILWSDNGLGDMADLWRNPSSNTVYHGANL